MNNRMLKSLLFFTIPIIWLVAGAQKCTVQKPANSVVKRMNGELYTWRRLKNGRSIKVVCSDGYDLISSTGAILEEVILRCSNGAWSQQFPECRERITTCVVPAPENGRYTENGQLVYDRVVESQTTIEFNIACDAGYEASPAPFYVTCEDGNWLSDFPVCQEIRCKVPNIENGFATFDGNEVDSVKPGETVHMDCHEGFALYNRHTDAWIGAFSSLCSPFGGWSEPFKTCREKSCSVPVHWWTDHNINFGVAVDAGDNVIAEHGEQIEAYCKEPISILSCHRGQWSSSPRPCPRQECTEHQRRCGNGECIRSVLFCDSVVDCTDLTDETNCTCNADQFRCNNQVCIPQSFACDGAAQCLDGSDEMGCDRCGRTLGLCSSLNTPDGRFLAVGDSEAHGSKGTMNCGPGQYPEEIDVHCVNGLWKDELGETAECRDVVCSLPPPVTNTQFQRTRDDSLDQRYLYGDVLNVSGCVSNLEFVGDKQIRCQADGTWLGSALCRKFCPSGNVRMEEKDHTKVNDSVDFGRTVDAYSFQMCQTKCLENTSFLCRSVSFVVDSRAREYICRLYAIKAAEEPQVLEQRTWWQVATVYCNDQ